MVRPALPALLPLVALTLALLLLPGSTRGADPADRFDTVLIGGTIHPGDGSEPFVGHLGIRDGQIAAVLTDTVPAGDVEIDCAGLVIAPGFIDLHNHSDQPILKRDTRLNANYLLQGCTTIVTGNCGSGHVDVGKYLAAIERDGAGTHVAHLLPQGSLRRSVMGSSRRDATAEELAKMQELTQQAMADGAFGMSTGLIYVPGTFTPTEELVAIARVVARHGGIYASHIRNEGAQLLESIDEALQIGEQAGLPVHVSHFKATGKANWGSLRLAAERIDQARQKGQQVTADQYPYAASSTSLEATLFPSWSRDGGAAELRRRLDAPETLQRIREELEQTIAASSRIQLVTSRDHPQWIGRSLEEIAAAEEITIAELAIRIQRGGGASVINFGMNEDEMQRAMPLSWLATASDGGAKVPTASRPHPRSYGTFPRKIGHYAIGRDVLSLAAAIRSCSSLPAEILGLTDRGVIAEGKVADLAIFDPDTFIDRATYDQPYQTPRGIQHVLVAGELAVYDGQVTGILAGQALRRPTDSPRQTTAAR